MEGMILRNGRVASGVGGGLCQMTNLLYWMTLHTPLTVTERWRHGYDVFPDSNRTQPFGSGATCCGRRNVCHLRTFVPQRGRSKLVRQSNQFLQLNLCILSLTVWDKFDIL